VAGSFSADAIELQAEINGYINAPIGLRRVEIENSIKEIVRSAPLPTSIKILALSTVMV
jgi:hypothetical protein